VKGTAAIAGTGVLDGGSVNADSHVLLGAGSSVNAVAFRFSGKPKQLKSGLKKPLSLHAEGDLVGSSLMYSCALDLQVSGTLELDDNRGGRLIHRSPPIEFPTPPGSAAAGNRLTLGAGGGSGLVQAVFAGTSLMLQCIAFGASFSCSQWGSTMAAPLATGNVTLACQPLLATCTLTARLTRKPLGNASQVFEVRRLLGTGAVA